MTLTGIDLDRDPSIAALVKQLQTQASPCIQVAGTWGSFGALLVAHLYRQLKRPILYVRAHIDDAERATDDLHTFGVGQAQSLPAWEGDEDRADATDEIRAARLRVVLQLLTGHDRSLVVTPIQALCQPIPQPERLRGSGLDLQVACDLSPEDLAAWLVDHGFEEVDRIDVPGQFARRGGIADIFAPVTSAARYAPVEGLPVPEGGAANRALALRVEFFGDTVESIREINLDTHRSMHALEQVALVSAVTGSELSDTASLLSILPAETLIFMEDPIESQEVAQAFISRVEKPERLLTWPTLYQDLARHAQCLLHRFASVEEQAVTLPVQSVQQYQGQAQAAWEGHQASLDQLVTEADAGQDIFLTCANAAEIARVQEILAKTHEALPASFHMVKGFVSGGFTIASLKVTVIGHHELFGQFALRRVQRPLRQTTAVDTLADLQTGDYVVHASYGIGKYIGIETIEDKGTWSEYITIEYANEIKVHVSVNNITLIQKYIGSSPKRPQLSKVGSKKWQKQKDRVAASVQDLAAELLRLQAQRQLAGGLTYESDTHWQQEFEECFPYQETPDQITALGEIKRDMERSVTMDRLLCGDVGYGKTELAMRAAFKTVENGKQVAILVPTTVLCVQHGRTFRERFADFPVTIEILNRFRTAKEARDIVARARAGQVDILIGTHRLISKDVGFKELGLLIIDEEQRFGVEHKERLKRLRVDVDILTLSATPIPRTLHMALLGLRDISSLATPPMDRRSVVTTLVQTNPETIRKGILRELNRAGQVFFLHNRVQSIARKTHELEKLLDGTGARLRIAHGQMSKRELEEAMISFVQGQVDVLVCTTIIESGLDIPNANTIFIDNADRFGLAELHQLRGRVGRYHHRAYAYMLMPTTRSISPIAAKRLKAIEEYSQLGAGFRIALRDLEIRGAGNILGAEQSGHIQLVGYQMYCEMLADAVRQMKGEPMEAMGAATVIDLGFQAVIPKHYISSDRHRLDVYRRIASARSNDVLGEIAEELGDVYGSLPESVDWLLQLAEIRLAATGYAIRHIGVAGKCVTFAFPDKPRDNVNRLFARVHGTIRIPDPHSLYLELEPNYFEPPTLLRVLRKLFGGEKK